MTKISQPHIKAQAVLKSDHEVMINILASDVPENFLGMAFHFHLDAKNWSCQKAEVGSIFDSQKNSMMVLSTMRESPQKELVVGLSLKRFLKKEDFSDGVAVSFYCMIDVPKNVSYQFNNAVLSIYDNGRRDMTDVLFEDGTLFPYTKKSENSLAFEPFASSSYNSERKIGAPLFSPPLSSQKFFDGMSISPSFYYFLFSSLFVFLLFALIFLWYKRFK